MPKKKKSIIAFLMVLTFLWQVWSMLGDVSQEFNIPIPILLLIILALYLLWQDETEAL